MEARTFMERLIDVINSFHMPLFMMISGYVYSVAYFDKCGQPNRNRIYYQMGNLFVIYCFYSVFVGLLKMLMGSLGSGINSEISSKDILMIWARPYAPYWYIYVLIILYLVFSAKKLQQFNRYCILLTLAIIAVLSTFMETKWFSIGNILYYMLFFYIGISRSKYQNWMIDNRNITGMMFCISVVLSGAVMRYTHSRVDMWISGIPFVNIIVGLGTSLTLWYGFEHIDFLANNRVLNFLGRSSLEIYVIHCIFTAGFRIVFSKIGLTNAYASIMLNFFLSTLIPVIFSFLCKRIGIYDILFRPITFMNRRREDSV